jgi:hypothetical protein
MIIKPFAKIRMYHKLEPHNPSSAASDEGVVHFVVHFQKFVVHILAQGF